MAKGTTIGKDVDYGIGDNRRGRRRLMIRIVNGGRLLRVQKDEPFLHPKIRLCTVKSTSIFEASGR